MTTIDRAALRRPLEDYIRSRGYLIQPTVPEREDITVKHLMAGYAWVLDVIDLACALIHARSDLEAAEARIGEADALREALIWCSGSPSFAPEGEAREGWVSICQPLLAATGRE